MAHRHTRTGPSYLRILLGLVLIVGILYHGKVVIVPLALAVLLTFILTPISTACQRLGIGRVAAVLVTVTLALGIFGVVGWGVGAQVNKLVEQLPDHTEKIKKKIADLRGSGEGAVARFLQMIREISEEPEKKVETPPDPLGPEKQVVITRPEERSNFERLTFAIVPVLEPLATAGLVFILVIFMLSSREDLRNRLIGLLGHGHLTGTTRVIVDTAHRLSSFLLAQLLLNIGFGAIFGLGLFLLGVPYAFLWGFLTGLLRYVPYIGTWISVSFPLLVSFALAPDWTQPVVVLVFFCLMELVVANAVEPLLFGHSVGVTPIALLVAAAFWTWVWGAIGLVLSTPLTVCMVVLGQHVPRFKYLALLLGDQPPLQPHVRYYQRLLSRDLEEAKEIAFDYVKMQGPDQVYDDVLLPALVLAQQHRQREGLSPEDEEFILKGTMETLDQLAQAPVPETIEGSAPAVVERNGKQTDRPLILACPAHRSVDELALRMFEILMKSDGCKVDVLSNKTLPIDVEDRVDHDRPKLVYVALPPGGLEYVRYLCRRLCKRFPDLPIIVGAWGPARSFDRRLIRLRSAGATYVTMSLLQAQSLIRTLLHPAQTPGTSVVEPAAV